MMIVSSVIKCQRSSNHSSPLWTCGDQAMMGAGSCFRKRMNPKKRMTILQGMLLHGSMTSSFVNVFLDNISDLFTFSVVYEM